MTHSTCATHAGYQLSCQEYDQLLESRDGCCFLCGGRPWRLEVDHDHSLGAWAVRGMLCRTCNRRVGLIENGTYDVTDQIAAYFAAAWHLHHPATAQKRRKAMPRANCPVCGLDCAIKKDGAPVLHWSRMPGKLYQLCPGVVEE